MAEKITKEQKPDKKSGMRSLAWKLPLLAGLAFLTMKSCDAFKKNMQEATTTNTTNSAAQAQQAKKPAPKQPSNTSSVANKILSYMTQPVFVSSDFTRQITGTAIEVELLDMTEGAGEGTLYLSIAAKDFDDSTLSRLTQNPAAVEFAKKGEDGDLVLGEYVYSKSGRYFFRFPAKDFKVNKDASVTTEFNNITYTVTVKELVDFISNESIYCGDLDFKVGEEYGVDVTMANHGALVAKSGEPSLKRLVSKLIASCNTKEERAQALLDFVSTEIEYDGNADIDGAEQLKRPSEVLMTRKADCSGKSILLASLLEQSGMDYRLIYFKNHVSVAVEGDYGNGNGLRLSIGKKAFSIAEPTAKRFVIGQTIAYDPSTGALMRVKDIKFYQRPGEDSVIHDAKTGKPVPFI